MTKAILWDMDGTLLDSEPAHHAALNDIAADMGVVVPAEFHMEMTGTTLENVYKAFIKLAGMPMDFEEWRKKKIENFMRHGQNIRRLDMAALAEKLQKQGVPMCIASNSSREEVTFCLAVSGLDKIIPTYICRNDVINAKPDPEIYLHAAAQLNVAPKNCLVVEDSLTGAKAGIAAKMRVLYHPQHPVLDENTLPKGLDFIAHDQSVAPYIEGFLEIAL